MYALLKLAENAKTLTDGKVFMLTFSDTKLKNLVIKLNKDQLSIGTTADNGFLPEYSERSISEFGKRPGRWTLFDTGDTYDSFKVLSVSEDAIIEFADLEIHDVDLQDKVKSFGEIIGLDDESISILIDEALPMMREVILDELFKGIK